MEEICNLCDLFSSKASTFNVIFYNFKGKQTLNSEQFHFQVENVVHALEDISSQQTLIGCILSPCLALPATILGILKVSFSFVFLDVHKPFASLRNLQKFASLTILLVEKVRLKSLRKELCCCWVPIKDIVFCQSDPIILLQSLNCSNKMCPNSELPKRNLQSCNSQLAYVIQTSGTTGDPKVVQVPHQCIVPNIVDLRLRFDVTCNDVVLLCSPLTFDPSVIDIFLAISTGCTLVIVPDQMKSIPKRFADAIIDSKVTLFQCTPSLFQSLGEEFIKNYLLSMNSCLKTLAFGGEPCPSVSKLHRWKSVENKTRIFNLYGLTELSCWASCSEIDLDKCAMTSSVPLGEPLLDTIIEVRNQEVIIGSKKRWCVINDEVWPEHNVLIMRSTGDIIHKTSDGQLYFEGRKDNVIKYKGQKLSLHRIQNFLEDMPEISNHFIHFDTELFKLLLFVVQNKEVYSGTDIRQKIIKKLRLCISNLPAAEVVLVPHIPLTAHGKSDHRKLLQFVKEQWLLQKTDSPSDNSWEEVISNFWKEHTNQSTITDNDYFILKGGDSILAVQLASDIEWKLQTQIPELVDKLLNESYKEVVDLIRSHLKGVSKMNKDSKLHIKVSNENIPEESASKRICADGFKCHEMSCRRGYSLFCNHNSDCICHAKEKNLPIGQQPSLKLICKFDLKKCIDASPTIAYYFQSDQLLAFVGSHSGLFGSINVMKQDFYWITILPNRIESSSCLSFCGNYIIVGCYDHHVYNLDVRDGTILWKFKTGGEVKSSPVVSFQNIVFVGSHDKHLYAIKSQSGELLWKKLIGSGSIFSSPAVSEHLSAVAAATLDGILSVLKMNTGATLWTYNHGRPLFSSPLFTSSAIFIGSTNNCLLQIDLSGSMVLEYKTTASIFSSTCLSSSPQNKYIIFGCHDSHVYCINFGCECIWKCICDSPVYSTPFTFKWKDDNYVAVGCTSGTLYILAENSGKIIYFCKCPGEIFSSAVVLNDFLIVGCRDNYVYCFKLCDVL